jgi:hypothetical protein
VPRKIQQHIAKGLIIQLSEWLGHEPGIPQFMSFLLFALPEQLTQRI